MNNYSNNNCQLSFRKRHFKERKKESKQKRKKERKKEGMNEQMYDFNAFND